jgi:hypothetical protein
MTPPGTDSAGLMRTTLISRECFGATSEAFFVVVIPCPKPCRDAALSPTPISPRSSMHPLSSSIQAHRCTLRLIAAPSGSRIASAPSAPCAPPAPSAACCGPLCLGPPADRPRWASPRTTPGVGAPPSPLCDSLLAVSPPPTRMCAPPPPRLAPSLSSGTSSLAASASL